MGVFRMLLASIVLASHALAVPPYGGVLMVQAFFVISGFYIQMILKQYEGRGHWRLRFYESRLLRIFIPYWLTMLVIAGWGYLAHRLTGSPTTATGWRMVLANLFIVGTETVKLSRAEEGCGSASWQALVIPQIWSVSIELMFYALAPMLLLCRSRVLAFVVLICAAAKYLLLNGRENDIFRKFECTDSLLDGIFPLEIGVFLAGALGYRCYTRFKSRTLNAYAYPMGVGVICVLTVAAALAMGNDVTGRLWYYHAYILAVILIVPFLYLASRTNRWDRRLGMLSYPFYIWHYFILSQWKLLQLAPISTFLLAEITTLSIAAVMAYVVEVPLNLYRHRHFRAAGAAAGSTE